MRILVENGKWSMAVPILSKGPVDITVGWGPTYGFFAGAGDRTPNDLDSHLEVPATSTEAAAHVAYYSRGSLSGEPKEKYFLEYKRNQSG